MVRPARELRAVHHGLQVLAVAPRQERERLRDAIRRLPEPVAPGVLPELDEQLPDQCGDALLVRLLHVFIFPDEVRGKGSARTMVLFIRM